MTDDTTDMISIPEDIEKEMECDLIELALIPHYNLRAEQVEDLLKKYYRLGLGTQLEETFKGIEEAYMDGKHAGYIEGYDDGYHAGFQDNRDESKDSDGYVG